MQHDYTDPIAKLLTYGGFDIRRSDEPWPDYLELGFTEEHVPDLIRMTMDDNLNGADMESVEVWSPLHAWRTLGQLRAVKAVKPLLRLFERLPDDDWLPTELPKVFSLVGPASIPAIAKFMADHGIDEISRISVPACLERIALEYPDHRDECVDILVHQLAFYETNGPGLNAFLVMSLTNLKATETIDLIQKAFLADCVDLMVQGDIEDVEIEMGLRLSRDTPPPPNPFADLLRGKRSREGAAQRPAKIGRNGPCPCGSGRKYKRCCGAN